MLYLCINIQRDIKTLRVQAGLKFFYFLKMDNQNNNSRREVGDVKGLAKLNRLTNYEYIQAYMDIVALAEDYNEKIDNVDFSNSIERLTKHYDDLERLKGRGRKLELTDYIAQNHSDRSYDLRVIDSSLKSASRNRTRHDLVVSANYVLLKMRNYYYSKAFRSRGYMTSFLDGMEKMAESDSRFIEALGVLDLSKSFNDMVEAHLEFKKTLREKNFNIGQGKGDKVLVDAIRKRAQKELEYLMKSVDLQIHCMDTDIFGEFLASLESVVTNHASVVARRTGKNSQDNEVTESKDNVDTTSMEQRTGMEGENQPAAASETKVGTQASPQRKGVMTLPIAGAELTDSSAVPQSTPEEPQEIEEPTVSTGSEGTDDVDTKSA